MIVITLFSLLALVSTFGYSFFFKKFLTTSNNIVIYNIDFFYGLIFLIFISFFLNFFFPLKFFTSIIFLIGILLFIYALINKLYQVNFIHHIFVIFIIIFITYYSGSNVDSPMYHLQILNWMMLNKTSLGLTNLEVRFGLNSSWHSFISIMNLVIFNFSLKYYLTSIILSTTIVEIFVKKKNFFISDIFLFLSISYLIFFSYIHPFNNGIILNHLSNPEVDIVSMLLFILSNYLFLKLIENNFKDMNNINLLFILIFLAISTKLPNISLGLFAIYIFLFCKNFKILSKSNIVLLIISFLWILKSFLNSGCLFHPIKYSCFNVLWSNIEQADYYSKVVMGFARAMQIDGKYLNFDYTIYSYDWFLPWFKDYFLKDALLNISCFLIIFGIILLLFIKIFNFKKFTIINKIYNRNFLIFLIIYTSTIYIWLKAPEIRFGFGWIIALPCLILSIAINQIQFAKASYLTLYPYLLCFLLVLFPTKHFAKFNFLHLINFQQKNYDYSNIVKIGTFDGVDIYKSKNWKCADFPKICINSLKKNYKVIDKFGYQIYLSENK